MSIDSSTLSEKASTISMSAGIFSPSEMITMSSGTSCLIGISFFCPFLTTTAVWTTIFLRAFTAFSALYSCMKPITAFITTIAKMARPSIVSWSASEIVPAIIRIIMRKEVNWERKIFNPVYSFFSGSSL